VAVDIIPPSTCIVHNNSNDLLPENTDNTVIGATQYILNRTWSSVAKLTSMSPAAGHSTVQSQAATSQVTTPRSLNYLTTTATMLSLKSTTNQATSQSLTSPVTSRTTKSTTNPFITSQLPTNPVTTGTSKSLVSPVITATSKLPDNLVTTGTTKSPSTTTPASGTTTLSVTAGGHSSTEVSCISWTARQQTMSQNGFYKGPMSETECKRMCVELAVCVAVDMNNGVCLLVNNLVDLAPDNTVTNARGSTQYILNRICTTPAVSAPAAHLSTEIHLSSLPSTKHIDFTSTATSSAISPSTAQLTGMLVLSFRTVGDSIILLTLK